MMTNANMLAESFEIRLCVFVVRHEHVSTTTAHLRSLHIRNTGFHLLLVPEALLSLVEPLATLAGRNLRLDMDLMNLCKKFKTKIYTNLIRFRPLVSTQFDFCEREMSVPASNGTPRSSNIYTRNRDHPAALCRRSRRPQYLHHDTKLC